MNLEPATKFLIGTGVLLIILGIIWQFFGKFLHLGHLPGDIVVEKENFHFYFPIVTCAIISVLLSAVMFLIRHFGGKN